MRNISSYFYSPIKFEGFKKLCKLQLFTWLMMFILSVFLSSCNEQSTTQLPETIVDISLGLDDGSGPGTNFVKLEKSVEDKDWRVVVHWIKNRESLRGFSETYKPKTENYFLMVYVSFERNPDFKSNTGVIKLEYELESHNQTIFDTGYGNSETFDNNGLELIKGPDPNDPNEKRFNAQIYFEVPKKARHLRFIVGSLPPLNLRD